MSGAAKPRVVVCVPVYNGARFVAETLAALQRQTAADFSAFVSIDRSDDRSIEACLPFGGDPRFTLTAHKTRQGWVKNCNFLISRADAEYFCILPHDDLPAPDYLEAMTAALDARPEAVAAYSDVALFSDDPATPGEVLQQPPMTGNRFERVREYLTRHFNAVPFRALIRKAAAFDGPYFDGNAHGDFAADTLWSLRLASCGEFHRTPQPLYRKRLHAGAETQRWWRLNDAQAWDAWIDHCAACRRVATAMDFSAGERAALQYATLVRLMQDAGPLWTRIDPAGLSAPERTALTARFIARVCGEDVGDPQTPGAVATAAASQRSLADQLIHAGMSRNARRGGSGRSVYSGRPARAEEPAGFGGDDVGTAYFRAAVAAAPDHADAYRAASDASLRAGGMVEPAAAAVRMKILAGRGADDPARFYPVVVRRRLDDGDVERARAAAKLWLALRPADPAARETAARLCGFRGGSGSGSGGGETGGGG